MKRSSGILAMTLLAFSFAAPAFAEGTMSDKMGMSESHDMRASKLIGVPVYNDHNEKIGQIDEVILPATGGEVSVVLSVGSFTGGTKMVKIPFSHVTMNGGHEMMTGDGGKKAIMAMPNYEYMGGGGG